MCTLPEKRGEEAAAGCWFCVLFVQPCSWWEESVGQVGECLSAAHRANQQPARSSPLHMVVRAQAASPCYVPNRVGLRVSTGGRVYAFSGGVSLCMCVRAVLGQPSCFRAANVLAAMVLSLCICVRFARHPFGTHGACRRALGPGCIWL